MPITPQGPTNQAERNMQKRWVAWGSSLHIRRGNEQYSDVPGLAWPESPGLGLKSPGPGLVKCQARP
jgi:hypothetical protein